VVVPILLHIFKSWRIVFLVTGTLSMSWVFLWRKVYHSPETHPRLSEEEREMILSDRDQERLPMPGLRWRDLLRLRQTWGVVIGRSLTDPLWYFIADWFAIFLGTKGISIEQGAPFFWVPFLAADAGNFLGGGVSSWLVRRGWPVVRARKAVIVVCGLGMCSLMGCVFTSSILMLAALFAISTCCYAAWSTMALTLPSDLFPQEHVASVSGLSGAGSGLATVFSTLLIGRVADRLSFTPVLAVGSVIGLLATVAVLVLVRGVPKNPRSVEA
jgi:ACS family hexuronate transporter-like MFS transporter